MKILILLVVSTFCAAFGGSPVASAQIVDVYGTIAVLRISDTPVFVVSATQDESFTAVGVSLGATVNFIHSRFLNVGIDARDTICNQNTWLAGFEVKAKPPVLRYKPYFKLAVGRTNLNSTAPAFGLDSGDGFYLYNAALGVDYKWKRLIDLRLLEIGDGRTLGAGASNPTNILTINAGIVVHLP
jgi:hypothetical protein